MTMMTINEMMNSNGYYVDTVGGEEHYVTRDEHGFAQLGPRRRGARGLMATGHRPHRAARPTPPAQNDPDATILLPTGEEVGVAIAPVTVRQETESRRARWARRIKDVSWHRAVQHLAVDVAMWSACTALAAVVLKVAYVVVTL